MRWINVAAYLVQSLDFGTFARLESDHLAKPSNLHMVTIAVNNIAKYEILNNALDYGTQSRIQMLHFCPLFFVRIIRPSLFKFPLCFFELVEAISIWQMFPRESFDNTSCKRSVPFHVMEGRIDTL